MHFNRFLLSVFTLFTICSCSKPEEDDVLVHVHNATIKVNVNLQQTDLNGQFTYTPISGVIVELYKSEYDRSNNQNLLFTRTTDMGGLSVFYNLEEEYYYIRASHLSYGTKLDETSTPDGTVSFVQIDF